MPWLTTHGNAKTRKLYPTVKTVEWNVSNYKRFLSVGLLRSMQFFVEVISYSFKPNNRDLQLLFFLSFLRNRDCNNPPPNHGGRYCAGPRTETTICHINPCPISKYSHTERALASPPFTVGWGDSFGPMLKQLNHFRSCALKTVRPC